MQKHKYNIFPEMNSEDYAMLLSDLQTNGYDVTLPIWLYEGDILDGWNRYRACNEIGMQPVFADFEGSALDAIYFVLRTNKRRNLNSSQWACVAVEAKEIIAVLDEQIEDERRKNISKNNVNQYTKDESAMGKLISPSQNEAQQDKAKSQKKEKRKKRAILAGMFNTNSTYIDKAGNLKDEDPEEFNRVKTGAKTIPEAEKEKKKEAKEKAKKEALERLSVEMQSIGIDNISEGWHRLGSQYLFYGDSRSNEFISFIPKGVQFAFADPPYNADVAKWDNDFIWQHDYLSDIADVVGVTPGGWNAYEFYRQTEMPYIWETVCYIKNGMTHGKCGYANFIKCSIFGKQKPVIKQDLWTITIKINETEDTNYKGRKPYDFMIHLIELFTKQGGVIVDPFAGSGTTLLVSESMGRVSYNAEIQKEQCIEIINRAITKGLKYERI